MKKILIIDDEASIRWSLEEFLSEKTFDVMSVASGKEALASIGELFPNIVLLDLNLPDLGGLDVLEKIKKINPDIQVIMITGAGDIESAVLAMKAGAFHYVEKPFNLEALFLIIKNALEKQSLKKQVNTLSKSWQGYGKLIGQSPLMQQMFDLAGRVSASNTTTVLITGASGTGKGMLARAIHNNSVRKSMPFVDINCTAVPEHLLESELFGYEKGAFTDAKQTKQGLFELADEGTLFLDEIGDMSLAMQAKLLKSIEEKSFRRVGGIKDIKVDTRIIASTNKDLEKAVSKNEFRQDLYYRLKVIPISLTDLKNRDNDIEILADYFLNSFNKELGGKMCSLHSDTIKLLYEYSWPGNVRELKNVIERAVILSDNDVILPSSLMLDTISLSQ